MLSDFVCNWQVPDSLTLLGVQNSVLLSRTLRGYVLDEQLGKASTNQKNQI
jgi:hypothetical protein